MAPCAQHGCFCITKLFRCKSKQFALDALEIHNAYRTEHGVPPLVLSKKVCKHSQKWASKLAKLDTMVESQTQEYGESIYSSSSDSSTKIEAKDCVDQWYNEINDFSFCDIQEKSNCRHFTQIIWKSTVKFGIASARSKSGNIYVVANYYPPGNCSGQYEDNLLPPGANQFKASSNRLNFQTNFITSIKKTPSPRSSYSSPSVSKRFEEDFLKAHNEYRKLHGVPPMILSRDLCKFAKEWAQTIAKRDQLDHRENNDYGENLYLVWSGDSDFILPGRDPVDRWYSEVSTHKFGQEPTNMQCGHFTQIIWEDSKKLGVGVAKSRTGQIFVVANYSPPGNIRGCYSAKVRRPVN